MKGFDPWSKPLLLDMYILGFQPSSFGHLINSSIKTCSWRFLLTRTKEDEGWLEQQVWLSVLCVDQHWLGFFSCCLTEFWLRLEAEHTWYLWLAADHALEDVSGHWLRFEHRSNSMVWPRFPELLQDQILAPLTICHKPKFGPLWQDLTVSRSWTLSLLTGFDLAFNVVCWPCTCQQSKKQSIQQWNKICVSISSL